MLLVGQQVFEGLDKACAHIPGAYSMILNDRGHLGIFLGCVYHFIHIEYIVFLPFIFVWHVEFSIFLLLLQGFRYLKNHHRLSLRVSQKP